MLPPHYENPVLLGNGANSNVYRAYDTQKRCLVTFKWGVKHLSRHAPFRVRWHQEVLLLQEASGSNIVQVYDYGMWEERPYMVLEFIQDTLPGVLRNPQTVSCRLSWLIQLLDALLTLHLRGIIHQDINPDNILIDGDRLWLTDLSVARSKSMIHADASEVSGTMGWSSPEQQRREHKWVDFWTDIFSWGRIAHYLFHGDPAISYIQDIILQATAPNCLDRFHTVAKLRKVFVDKIQNIPEEILVSTYMVQDVIPVPFEMSIPEIPISRVHHKINIVQSEDSFGKHVRDAIRSSFANVYNLGVPEMVVVSDQQRGESNTVILEELHYLQQQYGPHVFMLDYEKTEGILHLVRDWVAPYNEKHEETIERIKNTLLSSRKIRMFQKEREANILALWSRRNVLTESEVGILFFIQKLQEQSQEGPIVLLINQPQLNHLDGEGLELCVMLLSKMFFSMPLLIIVRMEANDEQYELLKKQGAKIVHAQARTKEQFGVIVQHDTHKWYQICSGSVEKWRMVRHENIQIGDRYIDIVNRIFQRFEEKANESTKSFVQAIALSMRPVPVYVCRDRSEDLDEAFQFQILRVEGKWVTFCHLQVWKFLQKRSTVHSARLLGDLWKKAEHEDMQERYLSWCHAMAFAGSWNIIQSVLQRTSEQCFLFRRSNLMHEAVRIFTQYEKDFPRVGQQGYQAFVDIQHGRDWTQWGRLFLECDLTHKKIIVAEFFKKGHIIEDLSLEDVYHSQAWWNVLKGEKAFGEEKQSALQHFDDACTMLPKQDYLYTWSLMRWIELNLYREKGVSLEDKVTVMMHEARQLSSVRAIACASFVYGLFCFSQRRFDEGLHRLYHAGSTALICGHWSLWSRIMSHIAAYFLCNDQRDKALEVMQYKKTICNIKKIVCTHLVKEFWLVNGYKGAPPLEHQALGLDALCFVLANPSRGAWLDHKDTIRASLHPFVFAYVPMLSTDVISSEERNAFLARGSLQLC
ncbi:MAG: hypothetical protein CL916_08855 [Deltaproteobacteria bacterium]|nr:hypothetical protein [Deltaproteobacteria bacterium]